MFDASSIDPTKIATTMAAAAVKSLDDRVARQGKTLDAQQKSLTALSTEMNRFRTSLSALDHKNDGLLRNQVTRSEEHVATVTANSTAVKGSYDIEIVQLASRSQAELTHLDDAAVKKAQGTMVLTVGKQKLAIDMSKMNSLADVQKAINSGAKDSPAITASLVRMNGQVSLMISTDHTGVENSLSLSGLPAGASYTWLQVAKDAKYTFNGKHGSSSSNTIENVIDGVTVELDKITTNGAPLNIKIDTDAKSSRDQVQKFVDAYNKLDDSLNATTVIGSKTAQRGIFASDADIVSIDRNLKSLLRSSIGGKNITDFGITADKTGHLVIDSEKLDSILRKDPKALTALFNGKDGLIKKLDKSLDPYLSKATGSFKRRQDSIDRDQLELTKSKESNDKRYQDTYDRYLAQYSRLQATMSKMNQTLSSLGLLG